MSAEKQAAAKKSMRPPKGPLENLREHRVVGALFERVV